MEKMAVARALSRLAGRPERHQEAASARPAPHVPDDALSLGGGCLMSQNCA